MRLAATRSSSSEGSAGPAEAGAVWAVARRPPRPTPTSSVASPPTTWRRVRRAGVRASGRRGAGAPPPGAREPEGVRVASGMSHLPSGTRPDGRDRVPMMTTGRSEEVDAMMVDRRAFVKVTGTLALAMAARPLWAQPAQIEVLWLGQSATRITTLTGKVIVIDPFLTQN